MPACAFTGSRTDPSQHGRKNIIPQIDFIGLGEATVIDRFEIAGNIGTRRTGRLTRNILLEPMQVLSGRAFAGCDRESGGGFEVRSQGRYSSTEEEKSQRKDAKGAKKSKQRNFLGAHFCPQKTKFPYHHRQFPVSACRATLAPTSLSRSRFSMRHFAPFSPLR